jgi:hypothetical protein
VTTTDVDQSRETRLDAPSLGAYSLNADFPFPIQICNSWRGVAADELIPLMDAPHLERAVASSGFA